MEAIEKKLENIFADNLISKNKQDITTSTYDFKFRVGRESKTLDKKFKSQVGIKSSIVEDRVKKEIVDDVLKEVSDNVSSTVNKFLVDHYASLKENSENKEKLEKLLEGLKNQFANSPHALEYIKYAVVKGYVEMSKLDADQQLLLNYGNDGYRREMSYKLKNKFGTTDALKIRDECREKSKNPETKQAGTDCLNLLREIKPSRENLEDKIHKALAHHKEIENEAVKVFLKGLISSWKYHPDNGFSIAEASKVNSLSSERVDEINSLRCKNLIEIQNILEDTNDFDIVNEIATILDIDNAECSEYLDIVGNNPIICSE